jgi:hypothetical protein
MMGTYGTLKQVVYLMLFFICAGVIASFTLILKTLMLCGCFRNPADADPTDFGPISTGGRLTHISP